MHPSPSKTSLYSSSGSSDFVPMLSTLCTSFISLHVFSPSTLGTFCCTTSNLTTLSFCLYSHTMLALPQAFNLCPLNVTSFVLDFSRGRLLIWL